MYWYVHVYTCTCNVLYQALAKSNCHNMYSRETLYIHVLTYAIILIM